MLLTASQSDCLTASHSSLQKNSTFLGTGGVEAADLCSASHFLRYHVSKPWLCPGDSTSPPLPGNLSCIPSSHSWGEGMRKMPAALSPHCQWQLVPSSSWGRATSSEMRGQAPWGMQCGSSSEPARGRLMTWGSTLKLLFPWLSAWRTSCPPRGMRGHLWGCGIKWPSF